MTTAESERTSHWGMAERVRAFDWSTTALGPMDQWPDALRIAVNICLASRFPMFVWWGPDLINIYNDAYIPVLGKRHPTAFGKPARPTWSEIWDVIGPQADAVMQRGEATWNERVKLVMERKGYPEDTYFTWSYSPIRDAAGRIGGLFCACTEETQRVYAEAERDRLLTQRQLALDAAKMGWWHFDPVKDVATFDERFGEIFQLPGPSCPNAEALKRLHPDDAKVVMAKAYASLDPANPQPFDAEYRVVMDDGSIRWIEALGTATFSGEGTARRPESLVGTIADITQRKDAEATLRTSESRFRQLADAMPQIVWTATPDGHVDYYNNKWHEYVGDDAGAMSGRGWMKALHPDDAAQAKAAWTKAIGAGEPYTSESRLRRADGQYRWHLTRALPVKDAAGNVTRWFGTDTDIHDQKQLQQQNADLLESERIARAEAERASEAKSDFLATLSHELRTPLTPVLLTVSLMESHPGLPDDLREDIATIRRNVELESRLISDLLDLTRIAKGKLKLDMRDVDLNLIVRSAVDICQREASAKLTVELHATRHTVFGDSTRLQQVFWNLINNAAKFTPDDGTITVRSSNIDDGHVRVSVTDTGAGIDAEVLPRLFNAFEQGEVRSARQQAGLGLGLAISKRLAEAHGGTITAFSAGRGKGSTFTVDLPVTQQMTRPAFTPDEEILRPDASARRLNVLLVEDHEPTLRVMERLLRQIGHNVTGVNSVATAKSATAHTGYDLLISDLGLPDGSGLDIIRHLGTKYAGKCIALTGYGMESDIAASRDAGFAEHLTKPVDLASLETAIAKLAQRA